MAIDDNTSYELTGYQVKDLAQKVRAKADSASLANVATSGLYSDLIGAPSIPTVYNGTLTVTQGGNTLGTFTANQSSNATIDIPTGGSTYTAGNGIDITNDTISIDTSVVAEVSDIPTATSDLNNDSGFITSASLPTKTSDLTNDGSDGTSTYVEADELATVATSGSYTDLTNTPTIPAAQVNSDWNASSGVAEILNKPNLAAVATSGAYSDLTGTPTIPTVNDGTLTIQHNGTTKGTFTANQSTASTVNIETIYADDYISTSPIPTTVTTAMIEDGAVTTAKIDDGAVTNAKIDWTTTAQSYSTSEVDTGATWVDGRKIYKKTISCGGGSNQYKAVNHNVSNLRRMIKIEGQAYDGNVCIPIPFAATGSGTSSSVQVYVSSTQIVIECGTGRDNLTEMYITIWYTKTTD